MDTATAVEGGIQFCPLAGHRGIYEYDKYMGERQKREAEKNERINEKKKQRRMAEKSNM